MNDTLSKRFKKQVQPATKTQPVEFFKTGVLGIDYICGGGIPMGRSIELWGGESAGKSTTALEISRSYLEKGYKVFYVDAERTVSHDDFERLGLPITDDNFIIGVPRHGEEGIEMICMAMEEGFALVVIDSVATLIPESKQDKVDKDASARSIGSESTMWKENGSRIVSGLYDSKILKVDGTEEPFSPSILFINQQRANVGSPYGGKKTPGGFWLLHHYTIRIRLQLAKKAADEETGGRRVMYSLDKNKVAPPNRQVEMTLLENGIDKLDNLLNFAIWTGRIIRKGAWYFLSEETAKQLGCDVKLGQGATKVHEFLSDSFQYGELTRLIEEDLCT